MTQARDPQRAMVRTQVHFWNCMAIRQYRRDGVQAYCTGMDGPWFNGVLTAHLAEAGAAAAIARAREFFRGAQVPWLWSTTPICRPASLGGLLLDLGFTRLASHPVLYHDRPAPSAGSAFDIRPVRTTADLTAWTVPLYDGFGAPAGPHHPFRDRTALAGLDPGGPLRHWVGYQDGEPAACATLCVSRHGASIDNVATCARFRRRGWGTAITAHALAEARRLGCGLVCLEASEAGEALYRRLGFQDGYLREVFSPA